ncbi:MAG: HEPN domain-containing protein [Candidatus Cloacimonetes bacterium]|nr:HEPN domain-containing protein [Candidatus Cloacimonadota bacterium]
MKNIKYAEMLLYKSQQDLIVLKKLYLDTEVADEIKGFHAQQAAEKMLKTVLTFEGIEFPFTHRLSDLLDLLKDNKILFPDSFEELRFLTPFAVEFRYDYFEEDDEPTDFEKIIVLLDEVNEWVIDVIHSN